MTKRNFAAIKNKNCGYNVATLNGQVIDLKLWNEAKEFKQALDAVGESSTVKEIYNGFIELKKGSKKLRNLLA